MDIGAISNGKYKGKGEGKYEGKKGKKGKKGKGYGSYGQHQKSKRRPTTTHKEKVKGRM